MASARDKSGRPIVVVTGMMLAPLVILITLPVLMTFFAKRPKQA